MKLVQDTPLSVAYRVFSVRPPRPSLTVVVKGAFVPQQDAPALFADAQEPPQGERFFDDEIENSVRAPSDMALLKPVGELMVVGKAYTPGGAPMSALRCAFQVGTLKKRFAVFGDRFWEGSRLAPRLSDPIPFTEMPLCFERSYGGPGFAKNPRGRGRAPVVTAEGEKTPLPNLEDPDRLIDAPSAAPDPVATFPLHPLSEARTRHAGTYGEAYMRARWPYLPEDFRWEYFLEAPEDQRLTGAFFAGDERVGLLGLDRELPELRTQLPGLAPRVFLEIREEGKEKASFVELPVRLDTVTIDTEARRIFLCWRGLVEVPSEDLKEVRHLFVTHERLGKQGSAEELRARFLSCLEEEAAEERRAEGEAPLEEKRTAYFSRSEEEEEQKWTRFVMPKAPEKAPEEEERGTLVFAATQGEGAEGEEEAERRTTRRFAAAEEEGVEGEEAAEADEAQARRAALDAEIRAQLESLRASVMGASEAPEGAPAPDPAAAFAALGLTLPEGLRAAHQRLQEARKAQEEASEEVEGEEALEGPEDEPTRTLRASDGASLGDGARAALLERLASGASLEGLDLSEADLRDLDLRGRDLSFALLRGASLRGARLDGARLFGAVLAGADLTGASLAGANLARADLAECQAEEVSFEGAELSEAELSGARLRGARFSGAGGAGARFLGATLDGAVLAGAILPGADFTEASLRGASLREAHLGQAFFEGAEAEGAIFERADLRGARGEGLRARGANLRAILGDDSHWERADLSGADLSFSRLVRADFTEATLEGAAFDACVLRQAFLDRAILVRARLRRADLLEARLASADLRGADLRGANLFAAELWRAQTEGAELEQAELGRTHLELK